MSKVAVLGGCGTFMVGMASLAAEKGHKVVAFDQQFYGRPQRQLAEHSIELVSDPNLAFKNQFDQVVVGNALGRGHAWVESALSDGVPYTSGAAWLFDEVLCNRHVLAVAGTHGKTTTSSMLAWVLDVAQLNPGFLIGGFPNDFKASARLGDSPYFVVEADEYDTAFWDKRPKFMHYRPSTLILNNLEFDHADIYADVGAIEQQFKWLLRTVPANGQLIVRDEDGHLDEVVKHAYTPILRFGLSNKADYWVEPISEDYHHYRLYHGQNVLGEVKNDRVMGKHNALNALAAMMAAMQVGVDASVAIKALCSFSGVARRLEYKGEINGAPLFEDFAHHPTAMELVIETLRQRYPSSRIKVLLELGSYTLREGFHWQKLAQVLRGVECWLLRPDNLGGDLDVLVNALGSNMHVFNQVERLADDAGQTFSEQDVVVAMSSRSLAERVCKRLMADEVLA